MRLGFLSFMFWSLAFRGLRFSRVRFGQRLGWLALLAAAHSSLGQLC